MKPFNWFAISGILLSFYCAFMAVVVFFRARREKANILFSSLMMTGVIWGYGSYLFAIAANEGSGYLGWQIAGIGSILAPVLFAHFIFSFLGVKRNLLLIFFYIFATFLIIFEFSYKNFFWGELHRIFNMFYCFECHINRNPLMIIHFVFFYCFLLTYCGFVMFQRIKVTAANKRLAIKYFFTGSIIGWLGPHTIFLNSFGFRAPPIINFLILIWMLISSYAILRYNLVDINLILQKGLIYSILVAVITAIYFIFVLGLSYLFQGLVGYPSFYVNLSAIFIIAILFNPLRDAIQRFLDKRFFQGTLESLAQEKQRLQQELFHKEKLAYVGQLASAVVHEIRNPLTAIETYIQYLPQKYHEPDFRNKFHELIPHEITRIKNVVNNLLDLARPNKLVSEDFDLNQLIDTTLELLTSPLKLKDITVKKRYETPETVLHADKDQLRQVFLNLFLNAIQAMSDCGTLTINVSEELKPLSKVGFVHEDKRFIKILISDTGHGIPQEQLNKLFTPFQTTKQDGVGLGLVISKEIIDAHGGTIDAQSEVGKGTTFEITIPIRKS